MFLPVLATAWSPVSSGRLASERSQPGTVPGRVHWVFPLPFPCFISHHCAHQSVITRDVWLVTVSVSPTQMLSSMRGRRLFHVSMLGWGITMLGWLSQ